MVSLKDKDYDFIEFWDGYYLLDISAIRVISSI